MVEANEILQNSLEAICEHELVRRGGPKRSQKEESGICEHGKLKKHYYTTGCGGSANVSMVGKRMLQGSAEADNMSMVGRKRRF
jgi:hypothetical protein